MPAHRSPHQPGCWGRELDEALPPVPEMTGHENCVTCSSAAGRTQHVQQEGAARIPRQMAGARQIAGAHAQKGIPRHRRFSRDRSVKCAERPHHPLSCYCAGWHRQPRQHAGIVAALARARARGAKRVPRPPLPATATATLARRGREHSARLDGPSSGAVKAPRTGAAAEAWAAPGRRKLACHQRCWPRELAAPAAARAACGRASA